MDAFLTGSRVYGKPHARSDVDLVVYMTPETLEALSELSDSQEGSGKENKYTPPPGSLRFGRLNLICLTDANEHVIWKTVTQLLHRRKMLGKLEVTWPMAVDAFSKSLNHYKEHGTAGYELYYSQFKYEQPTIRMTPDIVDIARPGRKVIKGATK